MEVLEGVASFICDLLVFEEELPLGLELLGGLIDDDGPAIVLELEGFR
jgi:hypothetical protein